MLNVTGICGPDCDVGKVGLCTSELVVAEAEYFCVGSTSIINFPLTSLQVVSIYVAKNRKRRTLSKFAWVNEEDLEDRRNPIASFAVACFYTNEKSFKILGIQR